MAAPRVDLAHSDNPSRSINDDPNEMRAMTLEDAADQRPTRTEPGAGAVASAPSGGGWTWPLVGRIIIMILAAEIGYMVFTYPSNALVQIGAEFQTNQVAWLQTAYALTASVTAMIIGTLADRFGKRRIILVVLMIALIGLLLSAVAPNFGVLLVGRVLQSTTLALPFLLPSLVRDIYPVKTVPLAIALVVTGAGVLSIGVSLSAGFAIHAFGFLAVFWIPAIFVAVVMLLTLIFIPESAVRAGKHPIDYVGSALFGIGLLGVLLGISLGATWGWTSLNTLGALVGGAVFLAMWVLQSFRTRYPIIDLREFASFPLLVTFLFSLLGTSAGIWFFVINTTVALSPNLAGWGLALEPETASIFAALFTLGSFIGGITVGKLLGRISAATVGAFVIVFQIVGYLVALPGLNDAFLFGVAAFLIGISGGGIYAVVYNLVVLLVEVHKQATMSALVTVGANVGGAILPVVIFAFMNSNMTVVGDVPVYSLGAMQFALILPAILGVCLLALSIILRRTVSNKSDLMAGTRR